MANSLPRSKTNYLSNVPFFFKDLKLQIVYFGFGFSLFLLFKSLPDSRHDSEATDEMWRLLPAAF